MLREAMSSCVRNVVFRCCCYLFYPFTFLNARSLPLTVLQSLFRMNVLTSEEGGQIGEAASPS